MAAAFCNQSESEMIFLGMYMQKARISPGRQGMVGI